MSHDWSKIKRIASLEIGLVSIFLFFYFCMLSSSFHVHDAFDEHNLHFVALFFIKHLVVSLNPNSQKDDATKKMLNWPSKF